MSGLPVAAFKATCAHEYAHSWLNENLSDERRESLSPDAVEGFCELIAFRLMDAQNEEAQQKLIELNAYTRGHIHLFLAAEKRYGFDDIVDWRDEPFTGISALLGRLVRWEGSPVRLRRDLADRVLEKDGYPL